MRFNKATYIAVGAIVLTGVLLYVLIAAQPKSYNWSETFETSGGQPYDINIFNTLFEDYFPGKGYEVVTSLKRDTAFAAAVGANLVHISGRAMIDSADAERLISFAEKGNTVFVSAANAHSLLNRALDACADAAGVKWVQTRKAKRIKPYLNTVADTGKAAYHYQVADDLVRYPWPHFAVDVCSAEGVQLVGGFEAIEEQYTNYLKIAAGRGTLLLHCTPLIFSNYHLLDEAALAHAEAVLSLLPAGDIYFFDPEFDTAMPPNRPLVTESPLRFILGNPSLRWGWYLLIALSLIYVLSTMRRTQRPVPVITRPENETLRFLDVMTRFYRREGSHKHIVSLQTKLLMNHLRRRYRLLHHMPNEEFYREASEKLQVPVPELETFFKDLHRASNNSTLTENDLVNIDQKITEFYAKCP